MIDTANDRAMEALLNATLAAIPAPALIADARGAVRCANSLGRSWIDKEGVGALSRRLPNLGNVRVTTVWGAPERQLLFVAR